MTATRTGTPVSNYTTTITLMPVMVTVTLPVPPGGTLTVAGLIDRLNPTTVKDRVVVRIRLPQVPLIVTV